MDYEGKPIQQANFWRLQTERKLMKIRAILWNGAKAPVAN